MNRSACQHIDLEQENDAKYNIKANESMPKSRITDMHGFINVQKNVEGVRPFERFRSQNLNKYKIIYL